MSASGCRPVQPSAHPRELSRIEADYVDSLVHLIPGGFICLHLLQCQLREWLRVSGYYCPTFDVTAYTKLQSRKEMAATRKP